MYWVWRGTVFNFLKPKLSASRLLIRLILTFIIATLLYLERQREKMALSFTRIPWLWFGGKEKDQVLNGSFKNSINSMGDWDVGSRGEPESLKFYSVKGVDKRKPSSDSNRKARGKWKSREERSKRIDKEYDVVLVPLDGVCLSESESGDSDWSIGWLEPHAPDFQSDQEADDSFAVIVPCYRHESEEANQSDEPSFRFWNTARNFPADYSVADGENYMEQWLSSLHKF